MSLSAMAPLVLCTGPAFALSEIQREELPAPNPPPAGEDASQPEMTVPMPDPVEAPPAEASPVPQPPWPPR